MQIFNQQNAKKNSGYQVVKIIAFNKKADQISLPKNWLFYILKDYFFSYILESAKQWVPCTMQGQEKKFVFHIIEQIYIRKTDLFAWCWSQILKGSAGEEQEPGARASHKAQCQQNQFSPLWPKHNTPDTSTDTAVIYCSPCPGASKWLPPKPQRTSFVVNSKLPLSLCHKKEV